MRDFLYLDTLSLLPFQVLSWLSVFEVTLMILGLLSSFNRCFKLPLLFFSQFVHYFWLLYSFKSLQLALFLTQWVSCHFHNTCIFSSLSHVLHLRVLSPSYLKMIFFTISLAHLQCILKWSDFAKWTDIEDLAASQKSIWCLDSLCCGCLHSQGW